MSLTVVVVTAAVMLAGLLGVVLPFAPGLPLIWAAAVGSWWIAGMGAAGWVTTAVVTTLLAAAVAARFVLPSRGARSGGAPTSSLWTGLVGAVVGFFVVPVLGFVLGGVAGILVAERRRLGDWRPARRTTVAALRGYGMSVLVEIGAGVAMVATWAVAVAVS